LCKSKFGVEGGVDFFIDASDPFLPVTAGDGFHVFGGLLLRREKDVRVVRIIAHLVLQIGAKYSMIGTR